MKFVIIFTVIMTPVQKCLLLKGGLGAGSCAAPNEPGVYTAIASFHDWIQANSNSTKQ